MYNPNLYNPFQNNFQNPYNNLQNNYNAQQFNPQQVNSNNTGLIRVTGIEGAKAYQMSANSVVALFDNNEDIMYIKSTDGANFPTIKTFKFTPYEISENAPTTDFISRQEFENFKQEVKSYAEQFISAEPTKTNKSKSTDNKSS